MIGWEWRLHDIEGAGAYWESLGEVSGDCGGYWGLMRFLFDKSAS